MLFGFLGVVFSSVKKYTFKDTSDFHKHEFRFFVIIKNKNNVKHSKRSEYFYDKYIVLKITIFFFPQV